MSVFFRYPDCIYLGNGTIQTDVGRLPVLVVVPYRRFGGSLVRKLSISPVYECEPGRDRLLHAPQAGHARHLDQPEFRRVADGDGYRSLFELAAQVALHYHVQPVKHLGIIQGECLSLGRWFNLPDLMGLPLS